MSMTLLPTSLVAGALLAASARFTIPSALYFICFLYLLARPIVLAPAHTGESRLRVSFWIALVVISTLMTIAHITFQSILTSGAAGADIGSDSSSAQLLAMFDLTRLNSTGCGMVHILPDALLCVASWVGCVLSCRRARLRSAASSLSLPSSSSSSTADEDGVPATNCSERICTPRARVVVSVVITITSAMAAVALTPTLLMLPVTVGVVSSLVACGLSNKVTIVHLVFSYCKPAMLYVGLLVTALYCFQISGCNRT